MDSRRRTTKEWNSLAVGRIRRVSFGHEIEYKLDVSEGHAAGGSAAMEFYSFVT